MQHIRNNWTPLILYYYNNYNNNNNYYYRIPSLCWCVCASPSCRAAAAVEPAASGCVCAAASAPSAALPAAGRSPASAERTSRLHWAESYWPEQVRDKHSCSVTVSMFSSETEMCRRQHINQRSPFPWTLLFSCCSSQRELRNLKRILHHKPFAYQLLILC